MIWLNWDIRTRVLLVALVPTAVLGILLTILLTFSRLHDVEDALVQRGQALARQLASASEFGLFSGNTDALAQLASSALTNSDLQGVSIFDRDHKLVAVAGLQTHAAGVVDSVSRIEQVGSNMLRIAEPVRYTPTTDEDLYTLTSDDQRAAPPSSLGEIVVLLSLEPLQSRKRSQMLAAIGTLLIVLAATAALAALMSRSVSQPIRHIARAVTDIGRGRLDVSVPVIGGGSLRQLAEGLNDMAQRLKLSREGLEQQVSGATSELRERKEEAERANLAKSRFLAAASHDLRQPMHALGLFIAELADKPHNDDTRMLIERISASAEAMENLLDSLLDISKLDAGVVTANPRPFALGPLFERIASEYQHAAQDKGLILRVRPSAYWIDSDPLLFERILLNLVTNALRYTPRGAVMVTARKRGTRIHIEVRDSGIGIPQEAQDSVFQEFVQLDNAARDRSKGLGLGLAIVRRLAELLGHHITLTSLPDRGSIFSVEVRAARPIENKAKDERAGVDLVGLIVAIVDDDALAMESLAGLLRAWGCYVVSGESLHALQHALADNDVAPQVLISDFRLPGPHNGLEVIAALRQQFGPGLPGLLLSGDTGPEVLRQATDLGIPLLHKPVRPAKLRAAISHLAVSHLADVRANSDAHTGDSATA
ncbi:ATP-binding protein [Uliginosibacterium sp. H3]|uniref:histidine kinase n=1 Tax=Uliginosibacterium silvisoli TaxID=3114758 RepID=A0ABU6JXR4_9RHOO|nr:ATP-binding protein [Uliginosibacterium sp. H3]